MRWLAAALMLAATTSAQAQTYDPVQISPTEITPVPTSATPVPTNLGDDATVLVNLDFTFNYFGQDFTKAWISSNGFVSFQSPNNLCCNGELLENAQRNTIYQYWTDLVNWSGTPYYSKQTSQDGISSLLVGWYDTNEYGTNGKPTSFEMYLYDTGEITFNYIKTYDMQYHTVTAGLTGPTSEDNVLLFYGRNSSILSGTAYSFNYQTGTVTVDCNISPMDPSCTSIPTVEIPGISSPVETTSIVETIPTTQEVVVQEIVQEVAAAETIVEDTVEEAIAEQAAAEQVVAEQQSSTTQSAVATASATKEPTKSAERLNPSQLAALNAGGATLDVVQAAGSNTADSQQSGDSSAKASMQLFTSASNASIAMAEMEQQQQLQSSMESSINSTQALAGVEQNLDTLASGAQVISQSDGKIASGSYQDQQKLSGIDTNNSKDSMSTLSAALQPEQVIASVEQQYSSSSNMQQIEEDKSSFAVVQIEQSQSSITTAESRWQESLSSQSATLEALNTINNNSQGGTETQESGSSLGEGQAEVISQMAYVPGFSAYKLVSLPDRPDFYKPRRIYKNNRPVDAYMSIFKMTAANDNLWKQMVESQYE